MKGTRPYLIALALVGVAVNVGMALFGPAPGRPLAWWSAAAFLFGAVAHTVRK